MKRKTISALGNNNFTSFNIHRQKYLYVLVVANILQLTDQKS